MKLKLVMMLLSVFALSSISASAQQMSEEDQEKMMNEMMALGQPGDEHKIIGSLAGDWTMDGKTWLQPGDSAMSFTGTSHSEMVLGGRFLHTETITKMFGMETNQIGYVGFDRRHKKFHTMGMDTWGTYWVTASGVYDEKNKTITMYGEDNDPIGGFIQKYDFIWTLTSDDEYKFELIFYSPEMTNGADSHKMVEIIYTRAK